MTPTNDLVLTYKGKIVVVLTEAEIVNNTFDSPVAIQYLMERLDKAVCDLGVLHEDQPEVRP